MTNLEPITVSVDVAVPPERAWQAFTDPSAITQWNFASDDWHCPSATNDLRVGGSFSYAMAARDGSMAFEFSGEFVEVDAPRRLRFSLGPALGAARVVDVEFVPVPGGTRLRETFTPEDVHSAELQRSGWQAILENYRRFVERRP